MGPGLPLPVACSHRRRIATKNRIPKFRDRRGDELEEPVGGGGNPVRGSAEHVREENVGCADQAEGARGGDDDGRGEPGAEALCESARCEWDGSEVRCGAGTDGEEGQLLVVVARFSCGSGRIPAGCHPVRWWGPAARSSCPVPLPTAEVSCTCY
jgi:hypothetical protein